jgi:hypothetical protein
MQLELFTERKKVSFYQISKYHISDVIGFSYNDKMYYIHSYDYTKDGITMEYVFFISKLDKINPKIMDEIKKIGLIQSTIGLSELLKKVVSQSEVNHFMYNFIDTKTIYISSIFLSTENLFSSELINPVFLYYNFNKKGIDYFLVEEEICN